MNRYVKWIIVSLGAATLALTLAVALGWNSSSLAKDLVIFAVQAATAL